MRAVQREHGHAAAAAISHYAGIAISCLFVSCSFGRTAKAEEMGPEVEQTVIASNQPVSLDDAHTLPETVDPPAQPKPVVTSTETVVSTEKAQSSSIAPTRTSRRGRSATEDGSRGGVDVPWYRSGVCSLVVVLSLIGALYWGVRKFIPSAAPSESTRLQIVARVSLTPKHQAAILRFEGKSILVGISPQRISVLCDRVDSVESIGRAARSTRTNEPSVPAFHDVLSGETQSYDEVETEDRCLLSAIATGKTDPGMEINGNGESLKKLLNRLRAVNNS